ncbi:MAG: hypothetical protein A2V63_13350 [Candidatus Eisenbacteria bacterium RBG_19FT_COMBO_70_11]|nr:MAG: hypothetical protein A2V63_13350 [Candidatus Eisenbacteria bacterium RBG_19FT_COMBO_70_11]
MRSPAYTPSRPPSTQAAPPVRTHELARTQYRGSLTCYCDPRDTGINRHRRYELRGRCPTCDAECLADLCDRWPLAGKYCNACHSRLLWSTQLLD